MFIETLKAALRIRQSLDPTLFARTAQLIRDAEAVADTSGEYKRHCVYSRLIKEFPTFTRAQLALAIEVVKCSL